MTDISSSHTVQAPRSESYSRATAAIAVLDSELDNASLQNAHVSADKAGTFTVSRTVPADMVLVVIAASSI